MDIYLLGYMGSGKSSIGPLLAEALGYQYVDFDGYIEAKEGQTISQIFTSKGEIYFRKREAHYLTELLEDASNKKVVALGGGTPCYGNSMELLKSSDVLTVYINVAVSELTNRLWKARENRPLIAQQNSKEALEEYVRKHLFERGFYYNQASINVKTGNKSVSEITEEIVLSLF